MKKRFIMLGIVCLFMTGCQTAQKTIPEITTIAPADSAHEETETNKEERAEDASVAVKSLKKLEVQKEIRMIYHPRIKPYRLTPIITTASPTNTE